MYAFEAEQFSHTHTHFWQFTYLVSPAVMSTFWETKDRVKIKCIGRNGGRVENKQRGVKKTTSFSNRYVVILFYGKVDRDECCSICFVLFVFSGKVLLSEVFIFLLNYFHLFFVIFNPISREEFFWLGAIIKV